MPKVTAAYGDDAYIFTNNFINVVIPFERSGFSGTTQEIKNTTQKTENTTQKRIAELLKANPSLSRSELALLLNVTENGIKYHLNTLKSKGILKRIGPDKGGYWIVAEDE